MIRTSKSIGKKEINKSAREKIGDLGMQKTQSPTPIGKSPSHQIDAILRDTQDWRSKKLSQLRALIKQADPDVIEEVKWKKPSNRAGVPVWSHDGILCIGEMLKNAVRLTFPKGAHMKDPKKLFNTRLDSNSVRAIDFSESDNIKEEALRALILQAVGLNT